MFAPAATGLGVPTLVTARSHTGETVVTVVVLLFVRLGSLVDDDTVEVAVIEPAAIVGTTLHHHDDVGGRARSQARTRTRHRSGHRAGPAHWRRYRREGRIRRDRFRETNRRCRCRTVVRNRLRISDVVAGENGGRCRCRAQHQVRLGCRRHQIRRRGDGNPGGPDAGAGPSSRPRSPATTSLIRRQLRTTVR